MMDLERESEAESIADLEREQSVVMGVMLVLGGYLPARVRKRTRSREGSLLSGSERFVRAFPVRWLPAGF